MNFNHILIVGTGGMLGSVARFVTSKSIDDKLNSVFPFGTFAVNMIGSFVIGFIASYIAQKYPEQIGWRLFLGAGFCGGFTTFSAFALENVNLMQQKLFSPALLYISLTLIISFLAVVAGMALAKAIS